MNELVKTYLLPAAIALLFLLIATPYLVPAFGVFGSYAGDAATLIILMGSIWVNKKAQKHI
jgi:hypothetical protein